MTRAAAADQARLLDLQDLDSTLSRLDHRRRTLPEAARAAGLADRVATLEQDAVIQRTRVSDLDREVARAEREVEQVRARADRDRDRLAAGTGSSKDLMGLQHELETLAARQRDLEDVELEVMERRETDAERLAAVEKELAETGAELAEATAARDRVLGEVMADGRRVAGERASTAAGIDSSLVALYDKLRASRGGVGAARLAGGRCGGCHLDIPQSDLAGIRALPADEVVRCEECGRILVRTEAG
ncbi:MAG: zinc ribbon domain-containing protein [Kineosporiaceae bacterium]